METPEFEIEDGSTSSSRKEPNMPLLKLFTALTIAITATQACNDVLQTAPTATVTAHHPELFCLIVPWMCVPKD